MERSQTTRLRYISAKNPETIQAFLDGLGIRVQIYGQPIPHKGKWYLWFVPSDDGADIQSQDLGEIE